MLNHRDKQALCTALPQQDVLPQAPEGGLNIPLPHDGGPTSGYVQTGQSEHGGRVGALLLLLPHALAVNITTSSCSPVGLSLIHI